MQELTIRSILDLVASDAPDPENRIQEMYRWQFEHELMAAKALVGFAATLLIALILAVFEDKLRVPLWQVLVAVASIGATGGYGALRFVSAGRLNGRYLAALRIHRGLKNLGPFLRRFLRVT